MSVYRKWLDRPAVHLPRAVGATAAILRNTELPDSATSRSPCAA